MLYTTCVAKEVGVEIPELVGSKVRHRRQQLDISQQELGVKVGDYLGEQWSRQAVSAAEKGGRAFAITEVAAFAAALDTNIRELVTPDPRTQRVELPGLTVDHDTYAGWVSERTDREVALENEIASLHQVLLEQTQRLQAVADEYQRGVRAFAEVANPGDSTVFEAKRNLINMSGQAGEGDGS